MDSYSTENVPAGTLWRSSKLGNITKTCKICIADSKGLQHQSFRCLVF